MSDKTPPPGTNTGDWRNFYGRIKGKALHPAQQRDLADLLPRLALPGISRADNPERLPLDIDALFQTRPLCLEIGFGSGEHLIHQAKTHPETSFIGCEPYINGVASCLGKIRREKVDNIRLHPGDARDLFDVLPDGVIDQAFLLYPDPWPKARHHRRRFVTPEHLTPLHRVMAQGAVLHLATDIEDYVRQALEEVPQAGFTPISGTGDDRATPWEGWISTRYEQKALREGRRPNYLRFQRAERSGMT